MTPAAFFFVEGGLGLLTIVAIGFGFKRMGYVLFGLCALATMGLMSS